MTNITRRREGSILNRRMQCCDHGAERHERTTVCTEQYHYPSEDYPCLCDGLAAGDEPCSTCGHPASKHVAMLQCLDCGCGEAA